MRFSFNVFVTFTALVAVVKSSVVSNKNIYNFGPCYGPVIENNKHFTTSVDAQVSVNNNTLLWYPERNPRAYSTSNKKTDEIDVVCGPTGDFVYACNIDKLNCQTNLEPIYEMCKNGIFHSCKNNSNKFTGIQKIKSQAMESKSISVFPAEGYTIKSYEPLTEKIVSNLRNKKLLDLCVAHGKNGLSTMIENLTDRSMCKDGIVVLGAIPIKPAHHQVMVKHPKVLFLAGDLDGVLRFSNFAVAKFQFESVRNYYFGLLQGLSHHSFASFNGDGVQHKYDLQAEVDVVTGHEKVAAVVSDFVYGNGRHLGESISLGLQLAKPILKALQLEGSSKIGVDVCNSDFPTNPTCNYPKYPDFSLPPGPAKPPQPLPASNCICGSDWVKDYAFPTVSGAADVGFKLVTEDAFHSVSDVHPFHLPHIWNKCPSPGNSCTLNVTTLTENFPGSGSLFPNTTSGAPLSALELRSKMKSRTTLYKAVGLKPSPNVDKNYTLCKSANQQAWQWALNNAEDSVRKRFEANGELFVMVDDKEAPIGFHGPEWIEKTLVYNRVQNSKNGNSYIEVQSWTFVVGDFPVHSKYLPTGMHYCKLLSPARAMEWIYTDSLRMKLGLSKDVQ
jgi:hypothetical protein